MKLPTPFRGDGGRPEDSRGGRRAVVIALAAGLLLLVATYVAATLYLAPHTAGRRLRLDEFLTDLRNGRVQTATILTVDHRVTGSYDGGRYWVDFGSDDLNPVFATILNGLQSSNVSVSTDQQWFKGFVSGPQVTILLPSLILADALVLAILLAQSSGRLAGFGRSGSRRVRAGETKITFADVAGADEAVEELAEIRDFLGDPGRFLSMGARIPRGILLVGSPGCGKTLLARAVAGEADAQFFSISASAFVEMFVGVGAARIRDLFREAQAAAPSIIFIDELDAVGRGRTATAVGGQDERESTLNELLVGLDGFDRESGVVVIAATNRPDVLDPALLRPGRFDRRIVVDPPDLGGRIGVLRVHTRGKPLAEDVDLEALARRTPGFSGADLAAVVNEAALLAARRGQETITNALLWEGVERLMSGPERRSRLLSAREKRLIAYHEAGHALVAAVVRPDHRVSKISLMSRGRALGFTWYEEPEETHVLERSRLMERLAVMMGGRAAEEAICGEATSGAVDDLARASELARRMVCEMGMSELLGPISMKATAASLQADIPAHISPEMAGLVDREIRTVLAAALDEARTVLARHRGRLDRLAARLQEAECLEGAELERLIRVDAA